MYTFTMRIHLIYVCIDVWSTLAIHVWYNRSVTWGNARSCTECLHGTDCDLMLIAIALAKLGIHRQRTTYHIQDKEHPKFELKHTAILTYGKQKRTNKKEIVFRIQVISFLHDYVEHSNLYIYILMYSFICCYM